MNCEILVFLFGTIISIIIGSAIGGVIWGFFEAWWKDRHGS